MPIALLLHETTAAFRFGARVLLPWNHLVQVEEVLIDRARSAFLFKWFGLGLPLHGFHARIAIANLDELRRRYEKVKAEVRQRSEGPNLTEPLLGMAGVAAGLILTPGVAFVSAVKIVHALDWNVKWYVAILQGFLGFIAILISPFVGGVIAALSPALAAAGFAGYLHMGVTGVPELRSFYDLMGSAARLLESATRFIKLLLGPRSEIKNPILRGMLHLLDQFAKLFPHALGLVAVMVTRFGPLLLPLAAVMRAFRDLAGQLFDAIQFVFDDLVKTIKSLFEGPDNIVSPIQRIIGWLEGAFSRVIPAFKEILGNVKTIFEDWFERVGDMIEDWVDSFVEASFSAGADVIIKGSTARAQQVKDSLRGLRKSPLLGGTSRLLEAVLFRHKSLFERVGEGLGTLVEREPNLVRLNRIIDALGAAGKVFTNLKKDPKPKSTKPSVLDPFVKHAGEWWDEAKKAGASLPEMPEFEEPDEMLKRLRLWSGHGLQEDEELKTGESRYAQPLRGQSEKLDPVTESLTKYLQRARHPRSAFAGEKKKLLAEYKAATLPEALSTRQKKVDEVLRDLERVVGLVLPPEMRHLLIPLGQAAELLEEEATPDRKKAGRRPQKKPGKKEMPKPRLPVKDVPGDDGLLKLVVQRLRLHSKSGEREELREFLDLLQQKLVRDYPAPA